MAYSELTAPCQRCQQERVFRRHHPEHLLHAIVAFVTGGVWIPVWLWTTIRPGPFRCRTCGAKYVAPRKPAPVLLPVFAMAAAALLIFGAYHAFSFRPKAQHAVPETPAVVETVVEGPVDITAASLAQEFRRNPSAAEKQFAERELVISGAARVVAPAKKGGQTWLVFVDRDGEPLAQCLIPEAKRDEFAKHMGDQSEKPVSIRCRFFGYSVSGSLTLHQPELVH